MSEPPTYYELLGVDHTATPAEIRGAYVRLMKEHHPDSAMARRSAGDDFARILNRCYSVLRNPTKRAHYDAMISASWKPPHPNFPRARLQRVSAPRPRSSQVAFAAALATALAGACVLMLAEARTERTSRELLAGAAGWMWGQELRPVVQPSARIPSEQDARTLALLAKSIPLRNAETFSRDCFAQAAAARSTAAAERCVIFDTAFLYWRKAPGLNADWPLYFGDEVVRFRHLEVLAPFGRTADGRLRALRQRAFAALVESVRSHTPAFAKRADETFAAAPDEGANIADFQVAENTHVP